MKYLTEKQLNNHLKKYYLKHYGENETDEFYVNPDINKWKFKRNGKIIILICNINNGEVTEKQGIEF